MSLSYEKATGRRPETSYSLGDVVQVMGQVRHAIESVIEGKRSSVDLALVVLLAEGHLLVEDVPGVGKTMLAKALGRSIACSVRRIQFTPDLLPSDITGVSVFNQETRDFEFKPGGIFANIVVGDEINRASPEDPVRPAGVDGGAPGQRRRHHLPARDAVHGRRHPEPDRDGGHLSPPRGPAGPVHGPDPDGLPDAERRAGHARLARLLRPAGRAAAGDRRRDHPRPGRRGARRSTSARRSSTTSSRSSTRPATPATCGSAPHPGPPCSCCGPAGPSPPCPAATTSAPTTSPPSASRCWRTGCCRRPTPSSPAVR